MTEDNDKLEERRDEIKTYLARIRKTIEESNALVEGAKLRMQETDRFLAAQGLTREQVLAMRFTDEQVALVNEELVRRGYEPLDPTPPDGFDAATEALRAADLAEPVAPPVETDGVSGDEVRERAGKFRMMMREYRVS